MIKNFENFNSKKCAIFAHPDDELNILTKLRKEEIDIFYLTAGESGYRHSQYYGDPENVKKNIKEIRKKETDKISKYFGFKYEILNFKDINNQDKIPWDNNLLERTIFNISKKYDQVYTIGPLDREHHQHIQISNCLINICKYKLIFGNYYINDPKRVVNRKFYSEVMRRDDLSEFINILKSQGTMKDAIEVTGNIYWWPD